MSAGRVASASADEQARDVELICEALLRRHDPDGGQWQREFYERASAALAAAASPPKEDSGADVA